MNARSFERVWEDWHWWVGPPTEYTENSGNRYPSEAPGWPTFWGTELQCEPHYMDWSTLGTVHVFDVEVVPGAEYDVQAIGVGCNLAAEDYYSDPLTITTSKWGDVVGNYTWDPPQGVVEIIDMVAVLDKFRNDPWAQPKAQCDLEPDPPDQKINISDVTYVQAAFCGAGYPFDGPQEECPIPPPVGGCEADIRVDSNNDGVIDYFDDFLEETQGVTVIFNADDDNENGIADWEEADVEGEDDLVEMQLSAPECAPGMWTGWSLSWDVNAPLEVWWYPDKYCPTSECPDGYETEPLFNHNEDPGYYFFNRLPRSVWLEATDATGEDFEITFTIYPISSQTRSLIRSDEERRDKARARNSPCTNRGWSKRYFIVAKKLNNMITRASTYIDLKVQEPCSPLCPEPCALWNEWGLSGMFVAVIRKCTLHQGQKLWANMGYTRKKVPGHAVEHGMYAETLYKWCKDCTVSDTEFQWLGEPPPGSYKYQVRRKLDGFWEYSTDVSGREMVVYTSTVRWPDWELIGTEVHWSTELLNVEDRLCGRLGQPCVFSNCEYDVNGMMVPNDPLAQSSIAYDPPTPGDNEWGFQWIDGKTFKVWDKETSLPCEEP